MMLARAVPAFALFVGVMLVPPASAVADTPNCVGANEYNAIGGKVRAAPRNRVTRVFDIRGVVYRTKTWHGRRDIWVHYPECGTQGLGGVAIHFKDYKHQDDRRFRLWEKWLTWHD